MDPLAFFRDFIVHCEDGGSTDPKVTHSMDRIDNGNWTSGKCGVGQCVGSNHGVTAAALAAFRKVPVASVTEAVMHALTVDEAARIGMASFYAGVGLDRLPWDQAIASVADFGWGAGPGQAARSLQRMVGAPLTGRYDAATEKAYAAYRAKHGLEATARAWADVRDAFYRAIVQSRPANAKYLNGWLRRTAIYRPGTAWWARFGASAARAA